MMPPPLPGLRLAAAAAAAQAAVNVAPGQRERAVELAAAAVSTMSR
jgi:hypothetical protein